VREHWGKERIQNLLQQRMHQPSWKEGVYMMAWRERGRDAAVKDARTNAGKNGKQAMQQYRMHE